MSSIAQVHVDRFSVHQQLKQMDLQVEHKPGHVDLFFEPDSGQIRCPFSTSPDTRTSLATGVQTSWGAYMFQKLL